MKLRFPSSEVILLHLSERSAAAPIAVFLNKEETSETEAELMDEVENVLKSEEMSGASNGKVKWGKGLLDGLRIAFTADANRFTYVCALKRPVQAVV